MQNNAGLLTPCFWHLAVVFAIHQIRMLRYENLVSLLIELIMFRQRLDGTAQPFCHKVNGQFARKCSCRCMGSLVFCNRRQIFCRSIVLMGIQNNFAASASEGDRPICVNVLSVR